MKTANESSLIGIDGRPRFGIYCEPMTSLNLDDFRPYGAKKSASSAKSRILKYRIKRWEYLGICNNDIIFGIAVVRLGYMCNLFAYLFDRRSARISEYDILTPGGGAAIFEGTSLTGEITFESGKTAVRMTKRSRNHHCRGVHQGRAFRQPFFPQVFAAACLPDPSGPERL